MKKMCSGSSLATLDTSWIRLIKEDRPLGVGIAEDNTDRWQLLGLHNDGEGQSYGFHADDGLTYPQHTTKEMDDGELYGQGDTIGCGYVRSSRAVYFTRNGVRLGEYPLLSSLFRARLPSFPMEKGKECRWLEAGIGDSTILTAPSHYT